MITRTFALGLVSALLLSSGLSEGAVTVENLRCEYRRNPLGIDSREPSLSWETAVDVPRGPPIPRGLRQTACHVLVASSEKLLAEDRGDLWDSGKVASEESLHVPYRGKPLESRTACFWKVKTWIADDRGNEETTPWSKSARWTMGLLRPEDWQARWLACPDADTVWLRKSFELSAAPERASVSVNIAGYAELYVNGRKVGGDVLTPALSDHSKQVFYVTFADVARGNKYQSFNQVCEFVSAGASGEAFENKFNYAGFRYVLVDGLPAAPAKEDAAAMLVESDLEPAGSFECSNELLNRIHHLNHWTQRCLDLGGYYVDCPHRDRLGYGDGQVAAEGFMTNFRADAYYRKWLGDWRLRQEADGSLPHVAPVAKGGGGPAWPGLLAAVTWRHYLYYGDRAVLEENYEAIRRYVDCLKTLAKDGILRKFGGKWDFIGDWVPPGRGMDTNNWPRPAAAELFNNC